MNKFLKMSLKALALPIFLIRVINGALIRFLPSACALAYSGINDRPQAFTWTIIGIVSLFWSFLYAVSTPSVVKLSYMYRNYPQKLQNLLKKRTAFWGGFVLLGIAVFVNSPKLHIYQIVFFCYVLSSVTINTMLMLIISSMGYSPFFEELCYKKSTDYENMSLQELYNESGMSEFVSKEGFKNVMNELKSGLKGKKR